MDTTHVNRSLEPGGAQRRRPLTGAGEEAAPSSGRPNRRFSRNWARLLTCALVALMMSTLAGIASAAVPTFPDNIVVFPDRDFISSGGFQDHVGQTGLVEVTRPGTGVVGSARVMISQGDVPFEINHPGGYCWGAGTDLNVTPDIRPGDVVGITFPDGAAADVATQDAYVTSVNYVDGQDTFTVVGHIGAGVNPDSVEQRIVNPELTGTAVSRRDIRAVPGPLAPSTNGQYQSSLTINGDTFTATYVFLDPAVARIAATGGGERVLSWQVTDAAANRQGLTIAEFGEVGGPGMGGCPNGPLGSGPRGPSGVTAVNLTSGGQTSVKVDWTPAVAIPGTPAITGYHVMAVSQSTSGGEQVEIGRRITGQAATGTTITGLLSGDTYDVYVVSVSSAGETFPAIHALPVVDTVAPTLTANPAGGTFATAQTVLLSAGEPNSQIFFTTDGTNPLTGVDQMADGATHYTGPITIASTTTLKAVAFDPASNVSTVLEETYIIDGNGVVPGAPTIGSTSVGVGSATLDWSLDPAFVVTDYSVQVNNADGSPRTDLATNPITTTSTHLTISGLTEGTAYYFTVTASNANGAGPASSQVGPLIPLGSVVANAGPDQVVTRGVTATTVTLTGAGSTPGATYLWEQTGGSAADAVTLTGATTLSPTFVLRLYRFPMTNSPLTFRLTVTVADGTVRTDDVKITPVPGDSVAVTRAQWKAGDFRIDGTGTVNGATITIHTGSMSGPVIGTATVTAGVWSLRLRNAAAGASRPSSIWIESTVGATAGPITVN